MSSCQAVYSLLLIRVVLVLWPPSAAQQGKKNARAREVSVFWGGRNRYRQGRGSKSLSFFGTGGKKFVCQPLGLVSTPGLSVALDNCMVLMVPPCYATLI